jgi:hypothetical protein
MNAWAGLFIAGMLLGVFMYLRDQFYMNLVRNHGGR